MGYPIDAKQVGALKNAVEAGGQISGLWPKQYTEFIQALAWFMGGPVESVDAFVPRVTVSGGAADQTFVLWLRGNSVGLLGVSTPKLESDPPILLGWIRPVSSVSRLEILGAEFYWAPSSNVLEEVRPAVQICFDDDVVIRFSSADRSSQFAREQVTTFIERLVQTQAGSSPAEQTTPPIQVP
jgi:hypothetical protein